MRRVLKTLMVLWQHGQEESSAADDENAVLFDVSSQQNVWPDDSHGVSSSLNEVRHRVASLYIRISTSSLAI